MMTRWLRLGCQQPEGQALVLACVMMLVLSLALITTVNLGHGVHERIRLQDTADAAAYSTAALEARAFNFYAFTNRTQVSHYVSAMMWQSLDSFLFSVQAFLTDLSGFMRTIGPCSPRDGRDGVFWQAVCALLDHIPAIDLILRALELVSTALRTVLVVMKPLMEPIDQAIGRVVIPGHRLLNSVLAGVSTAVMEATSSAVSGTSSAILAANDPNVDALVPQSIAGLINQCLYGRAHYKEANGTPLGPVNPFHALDPTRRQEQDKVARAKRVMANITNATRFACHSQGGTCPQTLLTDRRWGSLMAIPHWLAPLEGLLNASPKWGQTRLLTYQLGYGTSSQEQGSMYMGRNKIRESADLPHLPMGMLAQGDVLASDDPYYLKLPGPSSLSLGGVGLINPFRCPKQPGGGDRRTWRDCWGDPREGKESTLKTSIWALSDTDLRAGGLHWRVVFPGEASRQADRELGLYESRTCLATPLVGPCLFEMSVFVANTYVDPEDHNHAWPGLVPFPHFEPGDFAQDCAAGAGQSASTHDMAKREHDFNQPSNWVVLNKKTDSRHELQADTAGGTRNTPGLLNSEGTLHFAFEESTPSLELNNDRMKLSVGGVELATGMTAISRGQTYYHRPGNWNEQPNFFNPYWRPRLASIWQGKDSLPLISTLAASLPGALQKAPAKIITH